MPIMFFGDEQTTWGNGLVLRFDTYRSLGEMASWFEESLSKFKAWTIFQRGVGFSEYPADGPLKDFVWLTNNIVGSQIFVKSHSGDWSMGSSVATLRTALGKYPCDTIFEFEDGKVLFVSTPESCRTLAQRPQIAKALGRFQHWAIVDSSGQTRSDPKSPNVWTDVQLVYLTFADEADRADDDRP